MRERLFVRGRLLPLPWGCLATVPLRLTLSYQHELVIDPFGPGELPGWPRGTLRLTAGQSLGRFKLDGSVGLMLAQPDGGRPRLVGFELGAAASLRLLGSGAGGPRLVLTAEGVLRSALGSTLPSQQALLLRLLGANASGYGGGGALGTQVMSGQAGLLVMARMQISLGKANDDGGGAALLAAELLRQLQCSPEQSLKDQALATLSVLGSARSRGPLRARPPLSDRLNEGADGAAPPR